MDAKFTRLIEMIISTIFVCISADVGLLVSIYSSKYIGIGIFLALTLSYVIRGLKKVPTNPRCVATVLFFGSRTGLVKSDGWRFFPLYPLFNLILVPIIKINEGFPETVQTPDGMRVAIKEIAVTFVPDRCNINTYLDCGGKNGVIKILFDVLRQRIREWARSREEGPQTGEEALEATDEAVAVLIEATVGLDATCRNSPERIELKKRLKMGNGTVIIPTLGIVLNRLNIGEMELTGPGAKAVEDKAKETQERISENYEVETDLQKAQLLVNAAERQKIALPILDAYKTILEWKTTREGRGFVIPGVSEHIPELLAVLTGRKNSRGGR
jgi:hypothetical protein